MPLPLLRICPSCKCNRVVFWSFIAIAVRLRFCRLEGDGFQKLLCGPLIGGMRCHIEVHDVTAVMAEHDKHIKNAKSGRRDGEEINPSYTIGMVFKKRSPGLRGRLLLRCHILRDCGLRDIDPKLKQFPMDSRRTPTHIRRLHLSDQFFCFGINGRSTWPGVSTLPTPIKTKALPMPAHNSIRVQAAQYFSPAIHIA